MRSLQVNRKCRDLGSQRKHVYSLPQRCAICKSIPAQSANAQPAAATGLWQPRWEFQTPLGRLLIRPIQRDEVQAASVVLTRAFASSAEAIPLSEVLKDIESMLPSDPNSSPDAARRSDSPNAATASQAEAAAPADGYFLVARLFPDDPQQAPLPPGQTSRLVGTASLSLSPNAQPVRRLPPVNPPPSGAAYISNMAVDPRVRRRGVARALLAACEDAAARAGGDGGGGAREVWLHVREADGAARALYDGAGYVAFAKDSWMDTMLHGGMRPRLLMRRQLPPPPPPP